MIATGAAPPDTSAGPNVRPNWGTASSTPKVLGVTPAAATRSGRDVSSLRFIRLRVYAARASKLVCSSRHPARSWAVTASPVAPRCGSAQPIAMMSSPRSTGRSRRAPWTTEYIVAGTPIPRARVTTVAPATTGVTGPRPEGMLQIQKNDVHGPTGRRCGKSGGETPSEARRQGTEELPAVPSRGRDVSGGPPVGQFLVEVMQEKRPVFGAGAPGEEPAEETVHDPRPGAPWGRSIPSSMLVTARAECSTTRRPAAVRR